MKSKTKKVLWPEVMTVRSCLIGHSLESTNKSGYHLIQFSLKPNLCRFIVTVKKNYCPWQPQRSWMNNLKLVIRITLKFIWVSSVGSNPGCFGDCNMLCLNPTGHPIHVRLWCCFWHFLLTVFPYRWSCLVSTHCGCIRVFFVTVTGQIKSLLLTGKNL